MNKAVRNNTLLSKLVDLQIKAESMPRLSHVEKAKFDHSLAIDQLYYSSKLEGSHLTKEGLEEAIHGKIISTS